MMRFYIVTSAIVLALYAVLGMRGWEPLSEDSEPLPPSAKNAPGGYRSMSLWHVGLHGGK